MIEPPCASQLQAAIELVEREIAKALTGIPRYSAVWPYQRQTGNNGRETSVLPTIVPESELYSRVRCLIL
jgi:hypothetical protein